MGFWKLIWLFPVAVALHNAEEAVWLPAWSRTCDRWPVPWPTGMFRLTAALLTVLAAYITWMSARTGAHSVWTYLLLGYAAVALANVFVPHLLMTWLTGRPMPGTTTGVVLILPSLTVLLVLALRERVVSPAATAAYAVAVGLVMLLGTRLLLKRLPR